MDRKCSAPMKISSIRIKGYQQFQDTYLDFTHPETGIPVEKVCLIGKNGTGKSTLLHFLNGFLPAMGNTTYRSFSFLSVKIWFPDQEIYILNSSHFDEIVFFDAKIELSKKDWFEKITGYSDKNDILNEISSSKKFQLTGDELAIVKEKLNFKNNATDILIYSPPESQSNSYMQVTGVPQATLSQALTYAKNVPFHHTVSDENVQDFWHLLIYLIRKRENERDIFENKEENLNKTKKELIEEFEKDNPKILDHLAMLWNKILAEAGLEFDVQNARNPVQLNDNLQAFIYIKGTKQKILYSQLSTGIRNFIFRVGHIYSLYFNREIDRGFLLLDEPENSLFPDFLFDLVETYQNLLVDKRGQNNTQFFVSTHNPIIAAQFEPYERIILEWDDNGFVTAHKGNAPAGDDPNDVLSKDFKLKNLMGRKGQEMWYKYTEMRKRLRRTENPDEKKDLISEISKIGTEYNFED